MLAPIVRRLPTPDGASAVERLLDREWLVTNGLGGYASGTLAGVATRKYHGVLVAALPAPLGRTVMLNHLVETVTLAGGRTEQLSGESRIGGRLHVPGATRLADFALEAGLPVWRYRLGDVLLEKRLLMPHRQNSALLVYRQLEGPGPVRVALQPALHFRNYEHEVDVALQSGYRLTLQDGHYAVACDDPALPPLRFMLHGDRAAFTAGEQRLGELAYRVEEDRGYAHEGALWTPGTFAADVGPGRDAVLVASTESVEVMGALTPAEVAAAEHERRRRLLRAAPAGARAGAAAELVLAADQFVIVPAGRPRDTVRAHAEGDEIRTVIAGYHWFTDWGRDTMISLEGLTLATGRHREAGAILRTFAHYVRDGLIPNMFPDGSSEGLYHTADATLWFFHAVERYVQATGDEGMLDTLLPTLLDIIGHHRRGTRFGIGVDLADGLLRQGQDGYQLTWMDAKVDGWVVTPRRGKAVEINALWHNALRLAAKWVAAEGRRDPARRDESAELSALADRVARSFNDRFWNEADGCLYDVVDGEHGDSAECRPNQLFAISLDHPVLDRARWESVLAVVEQRLLTPVGLRSLAPGSAGYKPLYAGDLRTRDAAYHQGTVWGWLIGPWVDAWIKAHPHDRAGARRFLDGLVAHMDDFGIGTLAEVFDAEPPFAPRGCIAQAWSVAEVLRCWVRTAPL